MSRMLEFSSVTFSYNGATLFGGITLGVEEGARVALVGANGSGKTTLLKLAAGLLRPVEGSVSFQGRDLRSVPRRELARQMAYVPQQMVAPFDFTVRQIVEQGRTPHLKMMGSFRQRDREAVESAMEAAAVTSLANRVYNRLSGGEQQRVKIAVALAQEPKLLLLDEPTQHLDIGRQAEILELLADLNRRGVTMVAAIHDLYAVHWYFPSMILLHLDRKLVQGETEVILQQETIERAFGIHARVPSGQIARSLQIAKGPQNFYGTNQTVDQGN
ncbi:MAG TPA: ABC transporter ATP-binding protein [Candidatus Angelobacter sp.]|nr:ABC transporter ATP-binding protein [Candidatus Angelobacter sp.]